MSTTKSLPSRPRILGSNAHKYLGKNVTVVGEITQVTPVANSVTISLADGENMIVLLSRTPTPVEKNLLTEVSGKLVSRGQIEASWIKQFDAKQTHAFDKKLYVEACQVYDAHRNYYDF